jgi:hypothetical protein
MGGVEPAAGNAVDININENDEGQTGDIDEQTTRRRHSARTTPTQWSELLVNDLKNVIRHQTKILPLVKLRLTKPKGLSITLKDFLIGQLTGLVFASHWPVTILDVPPLDRIVELVVEEVETDGLNIDTNFDDEEGGEMQMEQHDESDLCIDTSFHDDDGEIGPDDGSQSSGTQRRLLNSKRCATSSASRGMSRASRAALWCRARGGPH